VLEEVVSEMKGLEALIGQRVVLFCSNYIYVGKLTDVTETFVELEQAYVVFETTEWFTTRLASKPAGTRWYVQRSSIESFGLETSRFTSSA
jgi:hypothetical protein